jgi:hypothetical protein
VPQAWASRAIWPLGQAGDTSPWTDFGPCTVQRFPISEIIFSIKISRNSLKFLKFIENIIKLGKIKNKFPCNPLE